MRLWRLLARAHLSGRVSRPALWLAWLSAPERRGLWRFVQAAPREQPAVVKTSTPVSAPWTRHVELLARASDGVSLGRDDACALLAAWQERLQAPAEAAWRARAVELGDANGERSWRAAQARIEGELLVLLESAPLTVDELGGLGELGARLALRVRDRLHADLAALIEAARPAQAEPDAPVEEWERWLMLRESVRRLEARAGFEAVRAAWHAGLRDVAWNRPCRVFNRHGSAAAQACYAMFAWTASLAKRLGEEDAARVNAENARIARRAA